MFKIIKKKKIEMIILVLFFCLMIVGCSSLESRQQNISDSVFLSDEPSYYLTLNEKDELTDISLITAIVDVINKNANMVDVYKAIPEKYKTNLSLYDFTVYLSILENEKGYRVSEFYRLNDEKKAELNSNLTTDMPSLALLTQKTEYYIFSFLIHSGIIKLKLFFMNNSNPCKASASIAGRSSNICPLYSPASFPFFT